MTNPRMEKQKEKENEVEDLDIENQNDQEEEEEDYDVNLTQSEVAVVSQNHAAELGTLNVSNRSLVWMNNDYTIIHDYKFSDLKGVSKSGGSIHISLKSSSETETDLCLELEPRPDALDNLYELLGKLFERETRITNDIDVASLHRSGHHWVVPAPKIGCTFLTCTANFTSKRGFHLHQMQIHHRYLKQCESCSSRFNDHEVFMEHDCSIYRLE